MLEVALLVLILAGTASNSRDIRVLKRTLERIPGILRQEGPLAAKETAARRTRARVPADPALNL